jgi:hypothetical protein
MMFSWAATVFMTHRRPQDQSVIVAGSMILGPFTAADGSGIVLGGASRVCLGSGV